MDTQSARHLFQRRNERIDWRKLASIDVEKIARNVDVDAIQENIVNVTYCDVEQELGYHGLDANVIKLFRLAQLTIEYLLHSQEFLQQCLNDKDRKLESFNEKLNVSLTQCSDVKDELSRRNDSYKGLKKELQKAKKLIGDYQLMVRSGASGLFKCTICTKSFVSEYYLKSHMERRHSAEVKQIVPPQGPNISVIQDEILHNELNEIKSRLKATEDELRREHENAYQLNMQEVERNRELLDILKQQDLQKNQEKEQIKIQMEDYKDMVMSELKETQRENEELKRNIQDLHQSTELLKKSTPVKLQNDDGGKVYRDFTAQIKELTQQLMDTTKENEELKNTVEKWKTANKKLTKDDNKYKELYMKIQKMETYFQTQFDSLNNKYADELKETKEFCREYVKSMNVSDLVDGQEPLSKMQTVEPDSVSLWVSSNTSIKNCYRVSQQTSYSKGDWNDIFSFNAFLMPTDSFKRPVHVYTCGGSPYWRQFVSLFDQPPTPHYKKEFTFYGSTSKLPDTAKFIIFDTGGSTVIRSMISKKESVDGWREKGEYFYAILSKAKISFNRSGTYNSDIFQSVSDDEVSLSSLTGTDIVKDNLAEALKSSRENLNEPTNAKMDEDASTGKVEDFNDEIDLGKTETKENVIPEIIQEEKDQNEMFAGTASSSFLDATLPEKGQFYPFPNNLLAIARYNHSSDMVNAQREEIMTIVKDNLIKRGIEDEMQKMSSHMLASKMKNHEKELRLIEKQNPGCIETRKRILTSIENYACNESKRGKISENWKSVDKVKNAVRFLDAVTPSKKSIDHTPSNLITSTPKEHPDFNLNSDDSKSDSEWNSDELENILQAQDNKPMLRTGSEKDVSEDFSNASISPSPHVATAIENIPPAVIGKGNGDDSDSSEWDSDELSTRHLQDSPNVLNNFEEPYTPKMRRPTGENVKKLTASLESTLGSRDFTKKKVAGAVDLHPGL